MNKAVSFAKCEAERKGKDAAVARKRAREALDDVIKLDEKAKSDVEFSANRDQKPSLSPASTNSYQLKKPKADHPSVK
ncbi:BnaC08g42720D [Brassica napus]|uniref:BnaC08g42720D protein n=3 Tax=Brassica TaxID=3705 RepID=A0A078GDC7_BRANA|nr:BnaC08g42720D [Brassica napus]